MMAAVICSRRKICWKVWRTVVVPAPDDPVMAMMGCLTDIGSHSPVSAGRDPEQRAGVEQRRFEDLVLALVVGLVVTDDPFDLRPRSQDQRHPLVKLLRHDIEDA